MMGQSHKKKKRIKLLHFGLRVSPGQSPQLNLDSENHLRKGAL